MSKKPAVLSGIRKHAFSKKMKELASSALAQKIGYLRVEAFSDTSTFETLPTQSLSPNRVIRYKDELYLVKGGSVEIWQTHHDYLVKNLESGTLFGEMPLLGQTMLGTLAVSGTEGATLAVIDVHTAREWIKANPVALVEKIGPRLALVETEHYRTRFQLADSRIASLLLELVGESLTIEGLTHGELGERIGIYRETATNMLNAMKLDHIIEVGRKRITILNKKALQELSEL
jgi:CRP/FNR family transcriptional regulator, cyclic AMP receptor protein